MPRAAALALFALVLAQIPWLDCRCDAGCVRVAAVLAPAGRPAAPGPAAGGHDCRGLHAGHGHPAHHAHESVPGTPSAPHDPDDHEHEIVLAVGLAGSVVRGLDAPTPVPFLDPIAGSREPPVMRRRAVEGGAIAATGPPDDRRGVCLLL